MTLFKNRKSAGLLLANRLKEYNQTNNTLVVGIAKGGIVVAASISRLLKLPLDCVFTQKITSPEKPELSVGAVNQRGEVYWDKDLLQNAGFSELALNDEVSDKFKQIKKKISLYKTKRVEEFKGKNIILVDDGIATGATVIGSIKFLQKVGAKRIIVAAPVTSNDATKKIFQFIDEVVVLKAVPRFKAVTNYYESFDQVSDEEVIELLKQSQ